MRDQFAGFTLFIHDGPNASEVMFASGLQGAGKPQKVPTPAKVLVSGENVIGFKPPDMPVPGIEREHYEKAALEAVRGERKAIR